MSTQVASWQSLDAHRREPCASLTPRSISSTSVRTWRVFGALVMTKASTTPKSSVMASTTVSWPSLASADSAAVAAAGAAGRARPTLGSMEHVQDPYREPNDARRGWSSRRRPSAAGRRRASFARPGGPPAAGPRTGDASATRGPSGSSVTRPAWRSSAHSVQTPAAHATDHALGHQAVHRPAPRPGSSRTSELETSTWGPSTHSPASPGDRRGGAGRAGTPRPG